MTQFISFVLCAYEKNRAGIKRQKLQTSVKNVIFMSAKNVSSNIIPVVNRKGNTLYNIFAMKVALSSLYFVFRVFLLIF